jgi:hypothetical protein
MYAPKKGVFTPAKRTPSTAPQTPLLPKRDLKEFLRSPKVEPPARRSSPISISVDHDAIGRLFMEGIGGSFKKAPEIVDDQYIQKKRKHVSKLFIYFSIHHHPVPVLCTVFHRIFFQDSPLHFIVEELNLDHLPVEVILKNIGMT